MKKEIFNINTKSNEVVETEVVLNGDSTTIFVFECKKCCGRLGLGEEYIMESRDAVSIQCPYCDAISEVF